MKVSRTTRPFEDVSSSAVAMSVFSGGPGAAPPRAAAEPGVNVRQAPAATRARPDFTAIYDQWFDEVSRWLRALGAPIADHEDLAQEVFLVVRRRLPEFDHNNTAGWLFRIASRQVAAYRRRKWWKGVMSRRPDVVLEDLPQEDRGAIADPASALERKERQRIVEALLRQMSEKRRTTFILFEIEGYSGEEVARLQAIPVATVWTRLHHARKEFFALADEFRRQEGGR